MACEVFKIVNKRSPEYINDLVKIKPSTYINVRAERQAEVPRVNTTRYGLRSFRSEAARVWNSIPNEFRVAESYPQFRRMIRWMQIYVLYVQPNFKLVCVLFSVLFHFC